MRELTDLAKLEAFMAALGKSVRGRGRIYFTGGTCALVYQWRTSTLDIDLKAGPEPLGFFEAIAELKETLNVNIELAAPDQFIPNLPGWEERSIFIAQHGLLDFYHYDFYSQALAKLERDHERDRSDVSSMLQSGLIKLDRLLELFQEIEPNLIRYPAITPAHFRHKVTSFCNQRQP
jgi:hypothetical protein